MLGIEARGTIPEGRILTPFHPLVIILFFLEKIQKKPKGKTAWPPHQTGSQGLSVK